eukprot:scaffold2549_cov57-Phaeocystis_antarctica.AAC.4
MDAPQSRGCSGLRYDCGGSPYGCCTRSVLELRPRRESPKASSSATGIITRGAMVRIHLAPLRRCRAAVEERLHRLRCEQQEAVSIGRPASGCSAEAAVVAGASFTDADGSCSGWTVLELSVDRAPDVCGGRRSPPDVRGSCEASARASWR